VEPLVSIIIPAYNARHWLGAAIDSALAQTYPGCETVVVDDGSTDGTGDWLRSAYGQRVRYLRKARGGLSSARNAGLRASRGELIQFLDADDLLLPEKVAAHAAVLQARPEVDVAYGHCLCLRIGSGELYEWPRAWRYRSGQIFASMIDEGYLHTHMPLSRRAALDAAGGFDESLSSCVEWDFWLRVARAGAVFLHVPGPALAVYRIRGDSNSQQRVAHARAGLRVLAKVRTYVPDPGEQRALGLRQAEGRWRFALGRALAESGHRARGLGLMLRALLADGRGLDYKLGYLALALSVGPARAPAALAGVKRIKDRIVRREGHGGVA
jgi:glycosyltransferase involved in cell wall biosynthesis